MSSQFDAHPLLPIPIYSVPIRKSHPVNSFQEKMHSSSLDDSLDMREFLAILQAGSVPWNVIRGERHTVIQFE